METIINEEWRSISGYLNYQVSNIGRVRNSKTGKNLKPGCVHGGYEQVNIGRSNPQKIHRLVAHEFIENPTNLPCVDHIDGCPKNNKISNLRWCNRSQNSMNTVKRKDTTSKYKGVSWDRCSKRWKVQLKLHHRIEFLDKFDSEIDAAKAYNQAAIKYFGEFAKLNDV